MPDPAQLEPVFRAAVAPSGSLPANLGVASEDIGAVLSAAGQWLSARGRRRAGELVELRDALRQLGTDGAHQLLVRGRDTRGKSSAANTEVRGAADRLLWRRCVDAARSNAS